MRRLFKRKMTPVAGLAAALAVGIASIAEAALVVETTSKGTVDTRLISTLVNDAFAVADTRRPIVRVSDKGPAETGPSGFFIIIR